MRRILIAYLSLAVFPALAEEALPAGAVRRLGEPDPKAPVTALAFSPAGTLLAVARSNRELSLWERSSDQAKTLTHSSAVLSSLAFSGNGSFLASGETSETRLGEFHIPSLEPSEVQPQAVDRPGRGTCAISAGRTPHDYLVAENKNLRIAQVSLIPGVTDGKTYLVQDLKRPPLWIGLKGSDLLILDAESETLRLWSTTTAKDLTLCKGPAAIRYATVTPDGTLLVSADESVIRLWNSAGKEIRKLEVPGVTSLALSADQQWLAAGLVDGTVLLWNLAASTGAQLSPAEGEMDKLWAALLEKEAFDAVRRMVAAQERTVAFLQSHLQFPKMNDAEIAKRLLELDHDDFPVREQASQALAAMGPLVAPALRKALAESPSAEVRERAKALLDAFEDPSRELPAELLRGFRAIQVLEAIGTPGARDVLKRLSDGPAEAPLTTEAKEALKRLSP